jgi:vancomycin resistance protein YoaR
MEKTKKKKPIILFVLISLFAIILGLGIYGYFKVLNTDLIYEGVKIEELDLSFMTKEEALKLIKDKRKEELNGKNMALTYDDKAYNINLKELGFDYDYNEAIEEAYSIGRKGNVITRLKSIINTKKKGVKIPLNSGYSKEKVNDIVNTIAKEIDLEMKEAGFDFNNGNIKITEEVTGRKVNEEKLAQLINDNIYVLNPIEIPVDKIKPAKTKELLSRINGVIGEFSTSFKGSSSDRAENIRIASKSMSKKVIMPGETISFNETTGPREKKFGYKEANVIMKGEFTPGVGGGVCQASTTLYNALLLADVTILERSPHSIPAKYVNFGQDAAVSYGHLDLKFRNDFKFPIYINSRVIGDRIHIYVYGDKNAKNYNVKIESEIVETIPAKEEIVVDKSLTPGTKELVQQGRTGYKVNTYKSIIKNGKTISKNLITKDFYRPRNFIYRVGDNAATTFSNGEEVQVEDDNIDD